MPGTIPRRTSSGATEVRLPSPSDAIQSARLYLVAPARLDAGDLTDFVVDLAASGVDLIQLREKELEAGDLLRVGEPIRAACATAGIPFVVNDRPDIALALEADGVHLGQHDLPVAVARSILGDAAIVGRSTHARGEIDAASAQGEIDYIAVGPVYSTPTKAGRQPVGVDLVRYAAEHVELPWFAIGGISVETLPDVIAAGARRVVVVRAVCQASDPVGEAARLRAMLDAG